MRQAVIFLIAILGQSGLVAQVQVTDQDRVEILRVVSEVAVGEVLKVEVLDDTPPRPEPPLPAPGEPLTLQYLLSLVLRPDVVVEVRLEVSREVVRVHVARSDLAWVVVLRRVCEDNLIC